MTARKDRRKTATVRKSLTVKHQNGLHMRKASALADRMKGFGSKVTVRRARIRVDAKSILQLLMLEAISGTVLNFTASGHDAEEAIQAITKFFEEELA